MKEKNVITEEMHLEKEWYKDAMKQTFETLPDFMSHVINDYEHDYGTIVHAITACALAAAWTANDMEGACGGITSFQAGLVMWDFIREWQFRGNKTALKIINYDDMIYPQLEDNFSKTISKPLWNKIQELAKEQLETFPHAGVAEHWENIVNGQVPFGYTVVDDE